MPKRILAGPLLASPSLTPDRVHNLARQRVPPPSTPRIKISCHTRKHSLRVPIHTTRKNQSGSRALVRKFYAPVKSSPPRQHVMSTERLSPRYSEIDVWEPADILDALIE